MQVAHNVSIVGGQDAGTKQDIKEIRDLVANLHSADVLAALKKGLKRA